MKKRFIQLAAVVLGLTMCLTPVWAARTNQAGETMIRVGLASSSSHNSAGEMACAHLENNTGYGAGYRFGYYDDQLDFVELARTGEECTKVAVLKTQNMYYGYVAESGKYTYSPDLSSGVAVGCYHIQVPGAYETFEEAAQAAQELGGFVAWINGSYQVRLGAYTEREGAEAALGAVEQGTIVGTSSYGINVVKTATDQILFQFDGGRDLALGVLPDVTGAPDVRTWFTGFKYRGGFTYQRLSGGDLTVVNVLDLESYVKGVVCYEMGRQWPLEALKAQAICARTYALQRMGQHGSLGFDVCNSDYCQVYRGVGSNRADYGPSDVSDQAVEETAGLVLRYGDQLADTYFSSSHGGASESIYHVWGQDLSKYPYLCGVEDPYEQTVADLNAYSSWTVKYTADSLTQRLQGFGYGTNTTVDRLELTYSELGNVIKVKVCYANGQSNTITTQTKPRGIRSVFGLNSIRFTVNGQSVRPGETTPEVPEGSYAVNGSGTITDLKGLYIVSGDGTVQTAGEKLYAISGDGKTSLLEAESTPSTDAGGSNQGGGTVTVSGSSYVFNGSGWGHQLGMSQYGANAMARLGFRGDEIVEFYFPGTQVGDY